MATTQLHNTTPDTLTEKILQGVQRQFKNFKKELAPSTPERYLTRVQTAKILSISLTTLNVWTNSKILKSYKLGNRTYYKFSEVENALNSSNSL